ncbi:MAG: hypothetical protein ABIG71_04750 [Candidatus Uhrbacteria bacterium]
MSDSVLLRHLPSVISDDATRETKKGRDVMGKNDSWQDQVDILVEKAMGHMDAQRWEEALLVLMDARQEYPQAVRITIELSNVFVKMYDYSRALRTALDGLALPIVKDRQSWHTALLINGAIAARELGDSRNAMDFLVRALDADWCNPLIHLNIARTCEMTGKFQQAIAHYSHALAHAHRDAYEQVQIIAWCKRQLAGLRRHFPSDDVLPLLVVAAYDCQNEAPSRAYSSTLQLREHGKTATERKAGSVLHEQIWRKR